MSAPRERLRHRGFDLRLENGFTADEARDVVERVLATPGDRVSFLMPRASAGDDAGRAAFLFVKAEFRRPNQPLSKRLKPARAMAEGRGYRAFQEAGLPVARLLAFGEQSRLRPRGGGIVVTEKVRGRDAQRMWRRSHDAEICGRVARFLAAIHAAGLVHGDALMRNFVVSQGDVHAIDLPSWSKWSHEGAEHDIARLLGSAIRLGADDARTSQCLAAYEAAPAGAARRLAEGWRRRVTDEADAYCRHLAERDATRVERRTRKRDSAIRPGERESVTKRA
jgi:tRNA A-37 threonylcarbamoyl transferase component Bud32